MGLLLERTTGRRHRPVWHRSPIAWTDNSDAGTSDLLESRIGRDKWFFSRAELDALTEQATSSGDERDRDLLLVRAHTRRGTPEIVREALGDFGLNNRGDVFLGSSTDEDLIAALPLFQHLVRVVRPSDWARRDGVRMNNQHVREYSGGGIEGKTITWHQGEFITVERSHESTSLLWSAAIGLSGFLKKLMNDHLVEPSTRVDYEVSLSSSLPRQGRAGTVSDVQAAIGNSDVDIASVAVPLENGGMELWWERPSAARQSKYSTVGAVCSRDAVVRDLLHYLEETGTSDVRTGAPDELREMGVVG